MKTKPKRFAIPKYLYELEHITRTNKKIKLKPDISIWCKTSLGYVPKLSYPPYPKGESLYFSLKRQRWRELEFTIYAYFKSDEDLTFFCLTHII